MDLFKKERSLLDTDLYKLTMLQAMWYNQDIREKTSKYLFKVRGGSKISAPLKNIKREIKEYCKLKFTQEELHYLGSLKTDSTSWFDDDFLNWLATFQLDYDCLNFIENGDKWSIEITGKIIDTTLFEIYLLSIISEENNKYLWEKKYITANIGYDIQKYIEGLLKFPKGFTFADFGTRRRFSFAVQNLILDNLRFLQDAGSNYVLTGTSNLYFAKKYDLKPIGTLAHEWFQLHQVLSDDLLTFQNLAIENWENQYNNMFSIYLTDTINTDVFLKHLDTETATKCIGFRQDSGDPVEWSKKVLDYYEKNNIDISDKTFVFSDGLNFDSAMYIFLETQGKMNVTFGIGTFLTNNIVIEHQKQPALNMVIKMIEFDGKPVAKFSDSKGKTLCQDEIYIERCKKIFNMEKK